MMDSWNLISLLMNTGGCRRCFMPEGRRACVGGRDEDSTGEERFAQSRSGCNHFFFYTPAIPCPHLPPPPSSSLTLLSVGLSLGVFCRRITCAGGGCGGGLKAHGLILPSPIETHRGLDQGHRGETSIQAPELHRLSMHGRLYSPPISLARKNPPQGAHSVPVVFPAGLLASMKKDKRKTPKNNFPSGPGKCVYS